MTRASPVNRAHMNRPYKQQNCPGKRDEFLLCLCDVLLQLNHSHEDIMVRELNGSHFGYVFVRVYVNFYTVTVILYLVIIQ